MFGLRHFYPQQAFQATKKPLLSERLVKIKACGSYLLRLRIKSNPTPPVRVRAIMEGSGIKVTLKLVNPVITGGSTTGEPSPRSSTPNKPDLPAARLPVAQKTLTASQDVM